MTLLFGASVIKLSERMFKAKLRVGEYTYVHVCESSTEAWGFIFNVTRRLDTDSLRDPSHLPPAYLTKNGFSHDPDFMS